MQPLILSAYTLATCLGAGVEQTVMALSEGKSGLAPCRFETVDIPTYVGAIEDSALAALSIEPPFDCRNARIARYALAQDGFLDALARARHRFGADRIALVLGTSTSGILQTELAYRERDAPTDGLPAWFDYGAQHNTYALARYLRPLLGLEGPASVLSAACATTAKAFASASRLIASGFCDAALVGGADSLCLTTLYGFHALGLISPQPCRPFDAERQGISIGEGAGFALLERDQGSSAARTVRVLGVGESGDAYHQSSPHPEGLGAKLAMERALGSARLAPANIDYINLHGTATKVGDAAEDKAITGLFGVKVPCSSTKSQTGHTLGAAGIVEAIICALSLEHGILPGSPNTQILDPAFGLNYVRTTLFKPLSIVMSNSFGFGGNNCSLILGRD